LNSNNGIEFIFLSNLFELLQILEGLNNIFIIQINAKGKRKRQLCLWAQTGRPKPHWSLGLRPENRGSFPPCRQGGDGWPIFGEPTVRWGGVVLEDYDNGVV
jgi:hypothetical protein